MTEIYSNDYEWSSKPMQARPQPNCRVVVEVCFFDQFRVCPVRRRDPKRAART